jgi:TonB-dependent SusC/RagA subfamily outer membrane receptor
MRIHRSVKMGLATGVMLVSGGRAADALAQERPDTTKRAAVAALPERVPETRIVDPKARPAPQRAIRLIPPVRPTGPRPMLIVDGEELPGLLDDYRDFDLIESIEIMKGASAVAMYGPRAAAGVILIRTKRP